MSGFVGLWSGAGQAIDFRRMRTYSVESRSEACTRQGDFSLVSFQTRNEVNSGTGVSPTGRFVFGVSGDLYPQDVASASASTRLSYTDVQSRFSVDLDQLGVTEAVRRMSASAVGAIWDEREKKLWFFRDRMGERSLYYRISAGRVIFSTDLRCISEPDDALSPDAICAFMRYGYVPSPLSIFDGIAKVEQGTLVLLDLSTASGQRASPNCQRIEYWRPKEILESRPLAAGFATPEQSARETDRVLNEAVGSMSHGAGVFLSGGVDSSLIAAILQSQRSTPVDTFTIGFEDQRHDESAWSAKVVTALGVRNTFECLSARQVPELLKLIPDTFSEPFADSSQIPTLLVSRLAGSSVGAVLTGDGADELFFGHSSYSRALRNARMTRRVPPVIRSLCGRSSSSRGERSRLGGMHAALAEASFSSLEQCYLQRVSKWRNPSRVVLGSKEPMSVFTDPQRQLRLSSDMDKLMYMDICTDVPDGLMTKLDRCVEKSGLVARHPFLDTRVVETAWNIPNAHLFVDGEHKAVLKHILEKYMPAELVYRPKVGFGSPVARWLSGPLRDWAESLLNPKKIENQGIFDSHLVAGMWKEFLAGQHKWHTHIWPILMFQIWLEDRISFSQSAGLIF